MMLFIFREVVLGEHTVGTDPDCGACPKVIKRKVEKVILHEDWNPITIENDIALLRLDESVPLFDEDPNISHLKV